MPQPSWENRNMQKACAPRSQTATRVAWPRRWAADFPSNTAKHEVPWGGLWNGMLCYVKIKYSLHKLWNVGLRLFCSPGCKFRRITLFLLPYYLFLLSLHSTPMIPFLVLVNKNIKFSDITQDSLGENILSLYITDMCIHIYMCNLYECITISVHIHT